MRKIILSLLIATLLTLSGCKSFLAPNSNSFYSMLGKFDRVSVNEKILVAAFKSYQENGDFENLHLATYNFLDSVEIFSIAMERLNFGADQESYYYNFHTFYRPFMYDYAGFVAETMRGIVSKNLSQEELNAKIKVLKFLSNEMQERNILYAADLVTFYGTDLLENELNLVEEEIANETE